MYPEFRWILRMTSRLLIVHTDKEWFHWVQASLQLIRGLWSHSIQWEWGNVGIIYNLIGFGVFPFIPSHWAMVYLRLTSFIGRILLISLLCLARHDLGFIQRSLLSLVVMTQVLRQLGLKNTYQAWPGENVSSPHPISRSCQDTRNPSGPTIPLG